MFNSILKLGTYTQLQRLERGKSGRGKCPTHTGRGRCPGGELSERGDVRREKCPTRYTTAIISYSFTRWQHNDINTTRECCASLALNNYFISSLFYYIPLIIIIISTTMFMVLSSWQSHCESSPGSFDECRM